MTTSKEAKRTRIRLTGHKHKLGVPLPNGKVLHLHYRRFKTGKHWQHVIVGPIVDLTKKTEP